MSTLKSMVTFSSIHVLLALGSVGVLVALPAPACADETPPSPNIIILLADDLGWNDVGYHGSKTKTPHIDSLAQEGVELDRFYVCPVCSPTRAGLMTGRYPIRYGLMRAVIPPWRDFGLSLYEKTLPEMLSRAGYQHRAIIGKWHLGHTRRAYHPLNRGFTKFYGHYNGAIDYFTHEREGELDWHDGFDSNHDEGYATDLLAEQAVRFIRESHGDDPFFLYVPFNAVHSPFHVTDEEYQANAHIEHEGRRKLAAMTTSLDKAIGRILSTLDELNIAENTLIWFSSDNGGVPEPIGNNQPLRGNKATVFEGGTRVAAAVRWPAGIPGGRKVSAPMAYIDVLPTLQAIVGIADHEGLPVDGVNVLEVIRGNEAAPDREIYNYIGQQGEETENLSVITPEWKLVCNGPNVLNDSGAEKREVMLFRIVEDPYEQTDLGGKHPEIVSQLFKKAQEFRSLQPKNGVPPYAEGREGFQAPKEWKIERP